MGYFFTFAAVFRIKIMSVIEIIGACIGLLYLILEYKANVWLWPVGIVMSLFYVIIYVTGKFYADAALQVYFIGANAYGLLKWTASRRSARNGNAESERDEIRISSTPKRLVLPLSLATVALWGLIYFVLYTFTDSPVAIGDAFTTALSIVAMWMLSRKYIEQWWLWVVVNVVCVALYFWKGLYPTAILYTVYVVVAVLGYFRWKKELANSQQLPANSQ